MKKIEPIPWITPHMAELGLTEKVINYITEKDRNITEDISWPEFFYIWNFERQAFESTAVFHRKINVLIEQKRVGVLLALATDDIRKGLLLDYLPIRIAVHLCKEFSDLTTLYGRVKKKSEEALILAGIRNLLPVEYFDESMLVRYYELSRGFPEYEAIALALVELKVCEGDLDINDLETIHITESIAKGLVKNQSAGFDESLKIFENTGYVFVLDSAKERIKESETGMAWVGEYMRKLQLSILKFEKGQTKAKVKDPKRSYLILVDALTAQMSQEQLSNYIGNNFIVDLLPPPDLKNQYLNQIMARVLDCMTLRKKGYQVSIDEFNTWYPYCINTALLESYCLNTLSDGINGAWNSGYMESGWASFEKITSAYDISLREELITEAITHILPKSDDLEESVSFLQWIKKNKPELWGSANKALEEGNRIETWVNENPIDDFSDNLTDLFKLLIN